MRMQWSQVVLVSMLALFAPITLFAHNPGQEQIGTVVVTMGAVTARDSAGASRTLEQRGQLYAGDTVIVGAKGFASIRMIDNGHISLGADTEFSFGTYSYDANPATRDSIVMELRRGCFRTVIGRAGSARRDTYRIDTPLASIAIDDAHHGAALVGERLYTATWSGTTTITNAEGSIRLGKYGDFDYSRTYPDAAPKGLMGLFPEFACEPPESLDDELRYSGTYIQE